MLKYYTTVMLAGTHQGFYVAAGVWLYLGLYESEVSGTNTFFGNY